MKFILKYVFACVVMVIAHPAMAWEMTGTRSITLHSRDGQSLVVGSVNFKPQGNRIGVSVHMDDARFKDFFLSMKEFKCIETPDEVFCHVPYPHANPASVTPTDLAWLEHALMFMFKAPKEFGAKLWNGIYYRLELTDKGLVGWPQAIDLNMIGAPPDDKTVPPYGIGERSDISPDVRWFNKLTIQ
jgi:hypothetical protein